MGNYHEIWRINITLRLQFIISANALSVAEAILKISDGIIVYRFGFEIYLNKKKKKNSPLFLSRSLSLSLSIYIYIYIYIVASSMRMLSIEWKSFIELYNKIYLIYSVILPVEFCHILYIYIYIYIYIYEFWCTLYIYIYSKSKIKCLVQLFFVFCNNYKHFTSKHLFLIHLSILNAYLKLILYFFFILVLRISILREARKWNE